MTKRTFDTKQILATIALARDNEITIFCKNGLATLELPKGYLYAGSTGLTLDVSGMSVGQAWYELAQDLDELVANRTLWTLSPE